MAAYACETFPEGRERLLTAPFVLLCAASFAFFTSLYLLLPNLPVYVQSIGGQETEVGVVIGAFSVTALAIRPWVGRSVDGRGRRVWMVAGTLLFVVCAAVYVLARSFPLLVGLRMIHGLGLAFFTTAASAAVADLAPARRRGEAVGYYGTATNLSMAVGPALGAMLYERTDFATVFLVAAGVALAAALLILPIPETRPAWLAQGQHAMRPKSPLFSRRTLLPGAVMASLSMTYGAIISFLPLLVLKRDLGNVGVFFAVFAVSLIACRSVAGALSDRFGRGVVVLPGLALAALAIWLLTLVGSWTALALVAVLYGIGYAGVQPALMALAVDRVAAAERGSAMGTFTAAFDLGIALGAFVGGPLLQAAGFAGLFLVTGAMPLVGLVAFAAGTRRRT